MHSAEGPARAVDAERTRRRIRHLSELRPRRPQRWPECSPICGSRLPVDGGHVYEKQKRVSRSDMSTIHLHQTTTATPQQFLTALTDFGPGRSKLFGNSADKYLKVHGRGPTEADVTEGSAGIWERLHYDWSDPD